MRQFNLPQEMLNEAKTQLSKAPAEDLFEIYTDTMIQFSELREKLQSENEEERIDARNKTEQLKAELKTKMSELYKTVGVDFNGLLKSVTKTINNQEHSIII